MGHLAKAAVLGLPLLGVDTEAPVDVLDEQIRFEWDLARYVDLHQAVCLRRELHRREVEPDGREQLRGEEHGRGVHQLHNIAAARGVGRDLVRHALHHIRVRRHHALVQVKQRVGLRDVVGVVHDQQLVLRRSNSRVDVCRL